MTEDQILEKLLNPMYFIERFFYIVDKKRVRVPFKFNPPQKTYFQNHTSHDLILKARKEGFSSLIEAIWLHACMFYENVRAVTLSHEMESTKRHFDRVHYFLENMGTQDKPFEVDLDEATQKQIKFPGTSSSYWIGTAGAKAFGRGDDITHLHLSEVAHYENQEVLTSALEACVPKAWKIMETTANGVGEVFHRLWKETKDPISETPWKAHFFSWFDDPANVAVLPTNITFRPTSPEQRMMKDYKLRPEQIMWYRLKRAEMPDKEKMPQEYPCNDQEAFLSSGRHAFNLIKLAEKRKRLVAPAYVGDIEDDGSKVKFTDDHEGKLKIWKMPRKTASYIVVGDSAEGVAEGDYNVAQILDRSTWEQVAVWRGRIDPGLFGMVMVNLGYFYNNAILIPELNNHGWATVESIKNEKYPHLLNTKILWGDKETPRDGFPTNEKTRNLIITSLRNSVDDDTIFINDAITIDEMESFVQNDKTGKFEAQKDCHDDTVTSLAIGAYCLKFLTLDESYGEHSKHRSGSPVLTNSVIGSYKRHSATGYR